MAEPVSIILPNAAINVARMKNSDTHFDSSLSRSPETQKPLDPEPVTMSLQIMIYYIPKARFYLLKPLWIVLQIRLSFWGFLFRRVPYYFGDLERATCFRELPYPNSSPVLSFKERIFKQRHTPQSEEVELYCARGSGGV